MKKFQPRYRRNGAWITGKALETKKDATEQAIKVWREQAFDCYQIVEVE